MRIVKIKVIRMECDKCKKTLLNNELSNVVLKDIGLESGKQTVRVEKRLCDHCYDGLYDPSE